ncbi:uncharacterized membrane protein YhaH (DUF805 family) [Amaricoccus macauensis]|uniref:Uncharacterized membrane protein YhaH (DUF805 family) n=1 Tax=Amaricoccus macauensis TaxID=57001 RepID=A0A840SRP3_9RHOB|nr:DUF805 domain-containing protein [Amaricoccus macauensis]MBB5223235.1 uncharacterized membrane protein YhaH (DUF805 family) [Amaricoccus macauensis]
MLDNEEPGRGPAPWHGFNSAIEVCLAEYFTFRGRASRSEYWFFALFMLLMSIGGEIADNLSGFRIAPDVGLFGTILAIALFIPSLAVTSRRFHDAGWSFWWYLMVFLPVIGWIFIFYVLVTRDQLPNRFDVVR